MYYFLTAAMLLIAITSIALNRCLRTTFLKIVMRETYAGAQGVFAIGRLEIGETVEAGECDSSLFHAGTTTDLELARLRRRLG